MEEQATGSNLRSFEDIQLEVAKKSQAPAPMMTTAKQDVELGNQGYNSGSFGSRLALRVSFALTLFGIFFALIVIPSFDIWAYFNLFNSDSLLQGSTLGMLNVTIESIGEFYLAYKMFPKSFSSRRMTLRAGFLIYFLLRAGSEFASRYETYTSHSLKTSIYGVVAMALNVILPTLYLPLLFRYILSKERQRNDNGVHQGWNPRDSWIHVFLGLWVTAFSVFLSAFVFDIDNKKPNVKYSSILNQTVIEDLDANTTITTNLKRITVAPMTSDWEWVVFYTLWIPFGLLLLLILGEKLKGKVDDSFRFSVKHMAVYLWILKILPLLAGTLMNFIRARADNGGQIFQLLGSVIFIALFLILEQISGHLMGFVNGKGLADVHYVFPLFFFEYYFAQLFFVDLKFTIQFFGLLGVQAVWVTFRNSGIVRDWAISLVRALKRYTRIADEDEDMPEEVVARLQTQVRIALQFLLCDAFSVLLVPIFQTIYLSYLNVSQPETVDLLTIYTLGLDSHNGSERVPLNSRLERLFLRYAVIFGTKIPFHIFAFLIIQWKHKRTNEKLREKDRRKLRIFEVCRDHLRHGWWLFIILTSLVTMMATYSCNTTLFQTKLDRISDHVTRDYFVNSTMDYNSTTGWNMTTIDRHDLEVNYGDRFLFLMAKKWYHI